MFTYFFTCAHHATLAGALSDAATLALACLACCTAAAAAAEAAKADVSIHLIAPACAGMHV
jgi:hypothetical protein